MKFGDITKHLSGKQPLKEAKTNEDLDKPRTSDKVLLTDDQLGSVAGGGPLPLRGRFAPGRTAEKENLRSQDREPTPVSCAKFTQLNERLCASIELTGAEMCRSFLLLFFEN